MRILILLTFIFFVGIRLLACDFTVSLWDTFGDGWNGGTISITVAGNPVLTNITLGAGNGPENFSFTANDGDQIVVTYFAGSWPEENWYTITNEFGNPNLTDGAGGVQPSGGTFTADCSLPPPPPTYDTPCNATDLTVNATCQYSTFTTAWATPSGVPNPTCGNYQGGDVWFTATVPASGRLSVNLGPQGMIESDVAIYTGPDCNNLTELRCEPSQWASTMPPIYVYTSDGLAGQTVWIRVWDPGGDLTGNFDICVYETPPPPVNNEPCGAIGITVNTSCVSETFSTESANGSPIPAPTCGWDYNGGDVWFSMVVPPEGAASVQLTANQMTNAGIALYTGTDCNTLTEIACSEVTWQMPTPQSVYPINGLAGETIWIRVWDPVNDFQGTFDICAFVPPPTLAVDTTIYTPDELITDILITGCLSAENVVYDGPPNAIGYFEDGDTIGFGSGIVLACGDVTDISGTDNWGDNIMHTTGSNDVLNDLSSISVLNGGSSSMYDAVIIEFDFIPSDPITEFNFVFASEEYPSFVNTSYNDVFAFFVSGPGISGPYADNAENIALVPGTNDPITISSINEALNQAYFGPEPGAPAYITPSEQFNVGGFTLPLTAVMTGLTPCETYHIKFAIADAGDGSLTSYVFFEEGSFSSGGEVFMSNYSSVGTNNDIYEGCENFVVFSRVDSTTINDTLNIDLILDGTATLGTDITNIPLPLFIAPGEMYDTVYYEAFIDGVTEGNEYIVFSVENGCPCSIMTSSDTIWVFDNFDMQPTIDGDTLICLGQTANITTNINPSFDPTMASYEWSTGDLNVTDITVSPIVTETFYVTIQDPCQQDTVLEFTVGVVPSMEATFTIVPDSVCTDEISTVTFTGNAGPSAVYTWDFDGGIIASGSNEGPYEVYWTTDGLNEITLNMDDNGCQGSMIDTVIVSPIPTSDFTINPSIICNGDVLTITYTGTASPVADYTWFFGGGTIVTGSGQGPHDVYWTLEGNHDVTLLVKEDGCTSPLESQTIYNPDSLLIDFAATNISCDGDDPGSVSFDIAGGVAPYVYTWSSGDGVTFPPGPYSVTITDGIGCADSVSFTIATGNPFVYQPTFTNLSCYQNNSGSISAVLTGGAEPYVYAWSHDTLGTFTADSVVSNLSAGTYYLTITDDSLCTVEDIFVISEPDLLVASIVSSDDINCYGGSNGSATVNANGGTANYAYTWDDGQTTSAASNLTAGLIGVTVSDANSCEAITSVVLDEPDELVSTIGGTDISCYNGNDGTMTVYPTGGTPIYSYNWSPQLSSASTATSLYAGTNNVTVTDANGCSTTNSFTINEPGEIKYATSTVPTSCFEAPDGTATIGVTEGGTPNFSFTWSTEVIDSDVLSSTITTSAGIYTVTVSDMNGCTLSTAVTIYQPPEIIIDAIPDQYICTNGTATLEASVTGGQPGYHVYWDNGMMGNTIIIEPEESQTVIVYATDISNCISETQNIKVFVRPPLDMNFEVDADSICPGEQVTFTIEATGGLMPYTFTLQNNEEVVSPFYEYPPETMDYTVTMSDNCETDDISATIPIKVMPEPSNSFEPVDDEGCAPHTTQFIESSLHVGQTYSWNFGDVNSINYDSLKNPTHTFIEPGLYNITLETKSDFGCRTIVVREELINVLPVPDADFTCDPTVASILNPFVSFTNYSTDGVTSEWIFGDGTDPISETHPKHKYIKSGLFYPKLIVTKNSCVDSVTGPQILIKEEYTIFVPTAFTPNDDGLNELFSPKIYGMKPGTYYMAIYDRFGGKVFDTDQYELDEGNNPIIGWDGRCYQGKKRAKNGVYSWYVRFIDGSGVHHEESGSVTVIR